MRDLHVLSTFLITELKQVQRRRQRERHLKMCFCNHSSIIGSHHAWKMCSEYPGIGISGLEIVIKIENL